jgi:hypothetical protein
VERYDWGHIARRLDDALTEIVNRTSSDRAKAVNAKAQSRRSQEGGTTSLR